MATDAVALDYPARQTGAMSAPALSATSSLSVIRDDLVFTSSRLLADPNASALETVMSQLLLAWTVVNATQLRLWDDKSKADALVRSADDNIADFITEFAGAMRTLPGGEKSSLWGLFFKVAPYELAAPVLGEKLEGVRRWSKLLSKPTDATLATWKKPLDKLIAQADAAVRAREEAALANEHFRTEGELAAFLESATKKRDGVAAELTSIAAKSKTLPRKYAPRFFRKRTSKVSSEERSAKAAKKAKEKQAKLEAGLAVKAAQAKVKAAMAELKAAQRVK